MREKPGALLKKTRESQGLSQDDVVKRLRLKLRIIQDIENDCYDNMSALVYMRGYLRAYSRFLNLKEDEVLQAFSELGIADPVKSTYNSPLSQAAAHDEDLERASPWLRWSLLSLLGFLILSAFMVWWNQDKTPRKTLSTSSISLPQLQVIIPPNPDASAASVSAPPVAARPEAEAEENAIKPHHKRQAHARPQHRAHHQALKPNYTLSPVTGAPA